MNFLKEIREHDLGVGNNQLEMLKAHYFFKKSARGVMVNTEGKVNLQFAKNTGVYVLPGGGIEDPGLPIEDELKRELREEAGATAVTVCDALGVVIEYRNQLAEIKMSYGFFVRSVGDVVDPILTEKEQQQGLQSLWLPFGEALDCLRNQDPSPLEYTVPFVMEREIFFLMKAKELGLVK